MSRRATGIALIALAASLWGTWPLYTRAGSGPSGLVIGFVTLAVMALPGPFVLRRADLRDRGAVLALVLVGLADAANVVLYFSALARGPVVVAVLTHYLAPTLVALTAPVLLGEVRSRRALFASPVVLAGLGLVLGPADVGAVGTTALLGAGSAVFYAVVVLGSRRAGRTFGPLAVTSVHSIVSALALLAVYRGAALPTAFDAGLAKVLFAAVVNGLVAAVLFNVSLRVVGAQVVGVLTYLEPLTAALLGVVVLGEPFTASSALGVGIVLAAGGWAAAEPAPVAEGTLPVAPEPGR